ncbi:MAG: hypothetical protein ACRDFC_03085 [Ignavibacteria bacterium]
MKKKIIGNLILPFLLVLWMLIQSCGEAGYQPQGDYISGHVFFSDTNLITSGGYYAVSVYEDQAQPYTYFPLKSDSIDVSNYSQLGSVYYRGSPPAVPGTYYFAVTWVRSPYDPNYRPPVLGTLGCDTLRSCTTYSRIAFPNFTGANYNILAWSDTTRRLY